MRGIAGKSRWSSHNSPYMELLELRNPHIRLAALRTGGMHHPWTFSALLDQRRYFDCNRGDLLFPYLLKATEQREVRRYGITINRLQVVSKKSIIGCYGY